MTETTQPAAALCAHGRKRIYLATLQKTARHLAATVCRMAMPSVSGCQNICDFIASTGYGLLFGAIKAKDATKLLYAAQRALASVPKEAKIHTPCPTPYPPFAPTPTNKEHEVSKNCAKIRKTMFFRHSKTATRKTKKAPLHGSEAFVFSNVQVNLQRFSAADAILASASAITSSATV